IALYYLKYMGGDQHVRKLVTLGTPYKGTWASLMGVITLGTMSPSTWQMLPGSHFLRLLASLPMPRAVEWTSVYAKYDALCPPQTARISPGTNYELPLGHAGLVLSADVYRILKRVLRRDHEPTTRTLYFHMEDGKWVRTTVASAAATAAERRKSERRKGERRT